MDSLRLLHMVTGGLLVAANGAVGAWGLVRYARSTSGRSRAFDQLLALSQTSVAAAGLFGLLLLASGHRPHDPLHQRVYGPFMVLAILAAWGFRRSGEERWNTLVFAVAALAIAALGVRALWTG